MLNKIDKYAAIDSIRKFVKLSLAEFKNSGMKMTKRKDWVFPMKVWTKLEYRQKGYDYKDDDFDYFQGGESHNHPAHDIFILDKDSDGVEDSTGKKVEAVSMVNGVVFMTIDDWKLGDFGRAGNTIKIFDPDTQAMFYYCHLDSIAVKPGDYVKAGDFIGYVGRTGRKAVTGRTHLHIAYYIIDYGYPKPRDIIKELYKSQKRMQQF